MILLRSGEALAMSLQKASSYLGAISTASGTIAFSFRLYDKCKLKKLNGDVQKIKEQYLELSEIEKQASDPQAILAGKVDRLGRALGSRSLAEKIQNAKGDDLSSEIIQKVTQSHRNDAICLAVFIITDIVNIISIAIPMIKMVGLSVTSIVASSVFTFGAVPIAIGLASVLMSAVPFLIRYFHQKKQQKALEGPQAEKPAVENLHPNPETSPEIESKSPSSKQSTINQSKNTKATQIHPNRPKKNWGITKKAHPGWAFF